MRARFAPSPTGLLHIGGLRTALYNVLLARKHGGTFILRIEDTDRSRYVAEAEQDIIDSLHWAGIDFDEGPGKGGPHAPYYQSERSDLYKAAAEKLLTGGHAYIAFDTPGRYRGDARAAEDEGEPDAEVRPQQARHIDGHTLVLNANRARIASPALVTSIRRLVTPVALAAKTSDVIIENLTGRKAGQFSVVLQQVQLHIEAAAGEIAQQQCIWQRSALCRIASVKAGLHEG